MRHIPSFRFRSAVNWGGAVSVCAVVLWATGALAEETAFTVTDMAGDHMVLQRNAPARLWGEGPSGGRIRATLAGKSASAVVAEDARWEVSLPALPAGGPYTLTLVLEHAESGKALAKKQFEDVMVGEVWFLSGQSNMAFSVKGTTSAEEALAEADVPRIRLNHRAGWQPANANAVKDFSAIGWYFAAELAKHLPDVPIGMVQRARGGTAICAFLSPEALNGDPVLRETLVQQWEEYADARPYLESLLGVVPQKHRPVKKLVAGDYCSQFFRQRLAGVFPYTFAGALWYQGESDAWGFSVADAYEVQLRALVADWRNLTQTPDLPVLVLQLPHYQPDLAEQPAQLAPWTVVQEAQARVAKDTENVGLVVSIDTGGTNIHPKNKRFFGRRAATTARGMVYGHDVRYRGPEFRAMTAKGGTVTIHFKHAEGLAVAGRGTAVAPTAIAAPESDHLGFCVAGEDRVFHWADARIDGESVVLRCHAVEEPVAVRYAFWDAGPWSLVNGAGLPAGPFRTDDWHWDLLRDVPENAWPKTVASKKVDTPPEIDGTLDDDAWRIEVPEAEATGLQRTFALAHAPATTKARRRHGDGHLYVAFECANLAGHVLRAEAKERDGNEIFLDDTVGLLVDANGDGETYWRIVVNPNGVVFDDSTFVSRMIDELPLFMQNLHLTRRQHAGWTSKATIATAVQNPQDDVEAVQAWTVEMAVPCNLATGATPPRIQFVRSFASKAVSFEWTPTGRDRSTGAMMPAPARNGFRQFHSPDRFGILRLVD